MTSTLDRRGFVLAALAGATIVPFAARGATGDAYATDGGEIAIHPISHASFVMTVPGMVIYNDPVGGADRYAGFDAPDLILITHQHGDHYDPETLAAIVADGTRLIVNPAVAEMLSADMKARASVLANGESMDVDGMTIEAVPAYNTTEGRLKYHPEGRDNGYVLSVDGRRVYIAGDTEDIPEMRALEDIDIAFLPMNLPYTMTPEQAADAVQAFRPAVVYPYHYRDQDPLAFAEMVGGAAEVVQGPWYGETPGA